MRELLKAELRKTLERVDAIKLLLEDAGDEPAKQTNVVPTNGHKKTFNIPILPDEFAFMEEVKYAAVQKLLTKLGHKATITEMVPMLEKGGLRLYSEDPSRAERNLRIAVRMRSRSRHPLGYDDRTDTVWLREWDRASSRLLT